MRFKGLFLNANNILVRIRWLNLLHTSENSRERNSITQIYKLLLPFRKCKLAILLSSNPKRQFYLSENNGLYFRHITKFLAKKILQFFHHTLIRNILGYNTETVCWVHAPEQCISVFTLLLLIFI